MGTVIAGIAVVTFIALTLTVYGQAWAAPLAGIGLVSLVGASVLAGNQR